MKKLSFFQIGQSIADDLHRGRQIELDVVRGIAILLAIGWHFNSFTGNRGLDLLLAPGRIFGWAGVDVFFVLSGFLVSRLILKEIKATGFFDIRRFYVRRIFKLWPMLYIFLIFMILFSGDRPQDFVVQIAFHFQNYSLTSAASHLWSLALEEQVYLILGLIIIVFSRNRKVVHDIRWNVALLCSVIFLICPLLRAIAVANGVSSPVIQAQTEFRIDAFAAGFLLAYTYVYRPDVYRLFSGLKFLNFSVCLFGILFLCSFRKGEPIVSVVGYSVTYISAVSLILLLADTARGRILYLYRILATAGVYSYALYIWHVPVGAAIDRAAMIFLGNAAHLYVVILKYLMSMVVAVAATRLIERPFLFVRDRAFPEIR